MSTIAENFATIVDSLPSLSLAYGVLTFVMCMFIVAFVHLMAMYRSAGMLPGGRPFKALKYLSDLIPPPRLRKRIQKMLADQAAHVASLRKRGRHKAAYWIEIATWALAVWYVLASPIAAVWSVVTDSFGGAGK